jgi:ABC-type nitrate/sulfonate/bicarbonate transport system substrate-binding protein
MAARRRAWAVVMGLVMLALGGLSCRPAAPDGGAAPAPAPASGRAEQPQAAAATAVPPPMSVRIVHSTRNGSQAIAQVLVDSGPLAENGLTGSLLHVDGPARAIAVLLTGDADVALMGGEAALSAAVEGAEIAIIGGFLNRRDHVLYSVPEVQSIAELRGKRVGINGVGAADQRAIVEALQHYRIDPQEIAFVAIAGGPPNRLAAIQTGAVDATAMQPPLTGRARAAGLRELVQIGLVVERAVPVNGIVASRAAVAERPELFRRFTRAFVQAVHLYHTQPEVVVRALANFFSLDLAENYADLEETRAHYGPLYATLPSVPVEGYRQLLEELAETTPRAAGFRLADALDDRFVREVEASGLHRELYGR